MNENNQLRKCKQCGNYFNPQEDKTGDLCKDCIDEINEILEKENEEELMKDYKKTYEETASTRVLNEEEIFEKLSEVASDMAYQIEGYTDDNRETLTTKVYEINKNQNRGLLIDITNNYDNVSVRYTMDYINDCPSETNTLDLYLVVNGHDLENYTIEHVNGEIEFMDGGIPYPLTEEGIISSGEDDFVKKVIDSIEDTFK